MCSVQKRGDVNVAIAQKLIPVRDTRTLLIKWIIGLLVPLAVFTFVWNGEAIINNALLGVFGLGGVSDIAILIEIALFLVIFYATVIALAGYLVAADSGLRGMFELWIEIAVFAIVPLLLVQSQGLRMNSIAFADLFHVAPKGGDFCSLQGFDT